jgi:hypothetical protein
MLVQSPLMVWELIHRLVELLNRTFENVSELDIMINSGLVRLLLTPSLSKYLGRLWPFQILQLVLHLAGTNAVLES